MNLKELNDKMLLKRFREQLLFGRFERLDFKPEILSRGLKEEMDTLIINCKKWKE